MMGILIMTNNNNTNVVGVIELHADDPAVAELIALARELGVSPGEAVSVAVRDFLRVAVHSHLERCLDRSAG